VPRRLHPGQIAEVWIADVGGGSAELVFANPLLEAPTGLPTAACFCSTEMACSGGSIYGPRPSCSGFQSMTCRRINDDHVLDAERGLIYLSANDCHLRCADRRRTARRITHDSGHYHFLHGVSPDGATLAFVELPRGDLAAPGRLALISSAGGETHYPEAGSSHLDGPDGLGCISTPRSSPDAPLTRNWLGYPPRAAALNVSWSPRRATGSRICR
jgi:TolB protein